MRTTQAKIRAATRLETIETRLLSTRNARIAMGESGAGPGADAHALSGEYHVRRILLALAGLALAGNANAVRAQNAPAAARPAGAPAQLPAANGEVRGIVMDGASKTPVARASVAVRVKNQPKIIAGAIASADGVFRVPGLRNGAYTLRVTYLGFGPRVQEFVISDAAPLANVGSVVLSHVAVALEGVGVTEERNTVAMEPDRNAYRAKAIAPAAANASEVLDAVPSVQVDADGKVSLRGNENVVVQINGRPTPISGTQLASYLKALPASIVDRVEVVPNPSAKYDPDGMAGIINIVLRQNVDLGLSGGANLGLSRSDRFNASGNLGYQAGRLTFFSNAGVNKDSRGVVGINNRERIDALRAPLSYTDQDIDGALGNVGQNLSLSADYKLTPRDVLSNAITLNHRTSDDNANSAYSELTGARAVVDQYDRLRGASATGNMFDYNVALKRTLVPRKHELSGEMRFTRSHDEDNTSLWRQPTVGTRLEGELDNTNALTKSFVAQTDYTRTLGERTKLETGLKGNARWLDRDYTVQTDPLGTGNWARSPLSNSFTFDETVEAAYAVLSQGVKKFDLQAGLRGEHARRDFSLASPDKSYPFSYNSLFPSAAVTYALSDASQLKASYSRRIRRPGSQELNPFAVFFDAQNLFIGNPKLNPEYTDAIELGLSRSGSLGSIQLAPFYRHTRDVIRVDINTVDHYEGREVTSVSFKNLATSNSWGTDLNGTLRLGPKFSGLAGFNVFKMVTDGGSTSAVGSDAVTWMTRFNANSQVTPTLSLQGSYFYRAPMKIEHGEFASMQMANVSVRKKIDGDNSSVTLRVSDPFQTARFRILAGDDNVSQLTVRNFGVRTVYLTFQYAYGQVPRVRQPRPDDSNQSTTPFP